MPCIRRRTKSESTMNRLHRSGPTPSAQSHARKSRRAARRMTKMSSAACDQCRCRLNASLQRRGNPRSATCHAERLGRKLERAKGLEPSTPTLARSCSTTELHPHPVSVAMCAPATGVVCQKRAANATATGSIDWHSRPYRSGFGVESPQRSSEPPNQPPWIEIRPPRPKLGSGSSSIRTGDVLKTRHSRDQDEGHRDDHRPG